MSGYASIKIKGQNEETHSKQEIWIIDTGGDTVQIDTVKHEIDVYGRRIDVPMTRYVAKQDVEYLKDVAIDHQPLPKK